MCVHAHCVSVLQGYIVNRNFRDTAFSLSGHETPSSQGSRQKTHLCGSMSLCIGVRQEVKAGGLRSELCGGRRGLVWLREQKGASHITPPPGRHAGTRLCMSAPHGHVLPSEKACAVGTVNFPIS